MKWGMRMLTREAGTQEVLSSPYSQQSIKNTGDALNQRAAAKDPTKGLELYAEGERQVDVTFGKPLRNTPGLSWENHREGRQTSGWNSQCVVSGRQRKGRVGTPAVPAASPSEGRAW